MGIGIIIDFILVAIVILNVIWGYKKGLINVIFNIFAFLIAIITTLILYKPISSCIINNTDIKDNIKQVILKNNNEKSSDEKIINTDKTQLERYVDSKIEEAKDLGKEKVMEAIAENISQKSIEVTIGFVIFIVIRIALVLLKFVTESIAQLPIIKQFNHVGGIIYGLIKSFIIIYLIIILFFIIMSLNGDGIIYNIINSSIITKFLYNNNIMVKYCLLGINLL